MTDTLTPHDTRATVARPGAQPVPGRRLPAALPMRASQHAPRRPGARAIGERAADGIGRRRSRPPGARWS